MEGSYDYRTSHLSQLSRAIETHKTQNDPNIYRIPVEKTILDIWTVHKVQLLDRLVNLKDNVQMSEIRNKLELGMQRFVGKLAKIISQIPSSSININKRYSKM